jgi:hypothetical protein
MRRCSDAADAAAHVARKWPPYLCSLAGLRAYKGSEQHPQDDRSALDLPGEALEEALDVAGYGGLAHLTGRWSWRWALAVWLAGHIARLMLAEQKRGGAR